MNAPSLFSLVSKAATEDLVAWRALQIRLVPKLEAWARSDRGMRSRRLAESCDDVREVVVQTLERLRANQFAALRRFVATPENCHDEAFERWLFGCLSYATREHLRLRFGRAIPLRSDTEGGTRGPNRRELNTLAPRYDDELPESPRSRQGVTARLTLHKIMEHARRNFLAEEVQALTLYIEEGASYDELARALGLGSALEAERLVRKVKERLRIAFKGS